MAMSPADLRRRRLNMLMAMSYASFASSKVNSASALLGREAQGLALDFLINTYSVRNLSPVGEITGTATSFITFTRSSNATRVNAAGLIETVNNNVPRIDYDPVTLAAKGLLVEEQRTNLCLRSAEFDNAAWYKANITVTANTTVSPTGAKDADTIANNVAATSCPMTQLFTSTGVVYTFSIWVMAGNVSTCSLILRDNTLAQNQLCSAAILSGPGSVSGTGATGIAVSGLSTTQWTRVAVTTNSAIPSGNAVITFFYPETSVVANVTGAKSVIVWGAQFEAGSFATSYIPTLAASATRSADVASVATSAFPYSVTEGTLVANFAPLNVAAARRAVQIDDGTENERVTIGSNSTPNGLFTVIDGGASQAAIATGTPAANTAIKIAARWNLNDFAASANGAAVATDTSGTLATGATTLRLGMGVSAAEPLNGWLRQVTYLPVAKTNAELQTRST